MNTTCGSPRDKGVDSSTEKYVDEEAEVPIEVGINTTVSASEEVVSSLPEEKTVDEEYIDVVGTSMWKSTAPVQGIGENYSLCVAIHKSKRKACGQAITNVVDVIPLAMSASGTTDVQPTTTNAADTMRGKDADMSGIEVQGMSVSISETQYEEVALRGYLTTPFSASELQLLKDLRAKCRKFKKGGEEWTSATWCSTQPQAWEMSIGKALYAAPLHFERGYVRHLREKCRLSILQGKIAHFHEALQVHSVADGVLHTMLCYNCINVTNILFILTV
ncbi:hypothetical protein Cgig2_027998 [Carnegiea gigantea]|uniref:Uncharacterized protein n=1 Tax=Carnegiea gigantea TaxID=171969 RepID=A0A9Q1H0K6_9CARY|nr:hypothetical protein Cgig2_027998 [Carnegiea gigantea]